MSRRIRAFDLGNPMMDDLPPPRITRPDLPYTYVVTLLPGSRPPEAYENWQRMIEAATNYSQQPDPSHPPASSLLLAAIAPGLENATLIQEMETQGWQSISWPPELAMMGFAETEQRLWQRGLCFLALTQRAFAACVHLADGAIAMAGTATEQCVGLGKPVVTFAGNGPQFTLNFALNQARLLGCSIERVESPELAFPRLRALLQNPTQLEQIRRNGQKRLGAPGAAKRIGQKILELGFGIQSDHESKDPSANGSKLERDRSGK